MDFESTERLYKYIRESKKGLNVIRKKLFIILFREPYQVGEFIHITDKDFKLVGNLLNVPDDATQAVNFCKAPYMAQNECIDIDQLGNMNVIVSFDPAVTMVKSKKGMILIVLEEIESGVIKCESPLHTNVYYQDKTVMFNHVTKHLEVRDREHIVNAKYDEKFHVTNMDIYTYSKGDTYICSKSPKAGRNYDFSYKKPVGAGVVLRVKYDDNKKYGNIIQHTGRGEKIRDIELGNVPVPTYDDVFAKVSAVFKLVTQCCNPGLCYFA